MLGSRVLSAVAGSTALGVVMLVAATKTAGADTASSHVGAEAGLARIVCVSGEHRRYSRGAIIDTGSPNPAQDVILTTSHGLPHEPSTLRERCFVNGGHSGVDVRIAEVLRPALRNQGVTSDWAVLLTERPLRGQVKRLPTARIEQPARQRLVATEEPVRLPLLFVAGERACSLTHSGTLEGNTEGVFEHTCRAWPGLSGSPVLLDIEGEPFVIGIHVGWTLEIRPIQRVGLYVDAAIVEAIRTAAAHGREARAKHR